MKRHIIVGAMAAALGFISLEVSAQTFVNNQQLIHTNEGAIIHVNGDLLNSSGTIASNVGTEGNITVVGNLSNDGDLLGQKATLIVSGDIVNDNIITNYDPDAKIVIGGNWQNNKDYSGDGLIELNGENQIIDNNNQSIAQLYTSAVGRKDIVGNILIKDFIQFEDGVIYTEANDSLKFSPNIQVNESLNGTSYIDGILYHELSANEMYYPIGKNGKYLPVNLSNVAGSKNTLLAMEAFDSNAEAKAGLNIDIIDLTQRWEKRVLNGKLNSGSITLYYSNDQGYKNDRGLEGIVVAEALKANGSFKNLGQLELPNDLYYGEITNKFAINLDSAFNVYSIGINYADKNLIYIPDALSPLAPNDNDKTVKVYTQLIQEKDFLFVVFDRWGNLVFETESLDLMLNVGWTGYNAETNNEALPDTYDYVLKGQLENGRQITRQGVITVIR